jgi:3-phosphoshikimate 1-carboxyvinyltransferase
MSIKGTVTLPGDKSLSHRALIFAAMSNGESQISNLSDGNDVMSTRECLEHCGIKIFDKGQTTFVRGGSFTDPTVDLNCGNSGTTTRLLLGVLAGKGINARFIGDQSLSSRPMDRILDPLTKMGLKSNSNDGKLPISIFKSDLNGISHNSLIPSAQIKSAILLAGIEANGETSTTESILSRNHTEIMLKKLGATLSTNNLTNTISKSSLSSLINFNVPGDPSTSSFFSTAAILLPNSSISIKNILLNPTRIGFYKIIEKMGAKLSYLNEKITFGEQIGSLTIVSSNLKSVNISKTDVPGLIDELPLIALLATQANGTTKVRDAEELRFKECDRIKAICKNLINMGANIKELDDGFIIKGPTPLKATKIKTYGDHRIAMTFAIAGLISKEEIELDNPDCVSISFPKFYQELERLKK